MNIQDKPLRKVSGSTLIPDQVIIRDFQPLASIGLFERERLTRQPVSIDIDLDIAPLSPDDEVTPGNIVRYDYICAEVSKHIEGRHVDLVETLAEDIAAICLSFARSLSVRVSVLKPAAIDEAAAVGVVIHRSNAR